LKTCLRPLFKIRLLARLDGLGEKVALANLSLVIGEEGDIARYLGVESRVDKGGVTLRAAGLNSERTRPGPVELAGDATAVIHELVLPCGADVRCKSTGAAEAPDMRRVAGFRSKLAPQGVVALAGDVERRGALFRE